MIEPWEQDPFSGAKIAVISRGCVVTLLRDDIEGLPWRGYWDLPGGGREDDEDPIGCALRELREETDLRLSLGDILWGRRFMGDRTGWFFGAVVPPARLMQMQLGDEGQRLALMPLEEFLGRQDAIPMFRQRLSVMLSELDPEAPL